MHFLKVFCMNDLIRMEPFKKLVLLWIGQIRTSIIPLLKLGKYVVGIFYNKTYILSVIKTTLLSRII